MINPSYATRILASAKNRRSLIILALDLMNEKLDIYEKMLEKIECNICAVKINFHILLTVNRIEIRNLNEKIHNYSLQSIANIKLNDIIDTNKITVKNLSRLKFDAVIVNPIMGLENLRTLVKYAHKFKMGVIC